MTPERIIELRSRDWPVELGECLDEIDRLKRDVAIYRDRDEKIVGRMMMERDFAREELARLKTPHCCGDCAHHRWINQTDGACGNMQTGVYRVDGGQSWICGHFKAKGNQ